MSQLTCRKGQQQFNITDGSVLIDLDEVTTYYPSIMAATIVKPGNSVVLPLMSEMCQYDVVSIPLTQSRRRQSPQRRKRNTAGGGLKREGDFSLLKWVYSNSVKANSHADLLCRRAVCVLPRAKLIRPRIERELSNAASKLTGDIDKLTYTASELIYIASEFRYGVSSITDNTRIDTIRRRIYPIYRGVILRPEGMYLMAKQDYILSNDGHFLAWVKNLYLYVLARFIGWSVPSPQLTLEASLTEFEAALAKLADPNYSKMDMERKKTARKVCEKAFRVYVQASLVRNLAVTDEDRVVMEGSSVQDGQKQADSAGDCAGNLG